MKWLARLSIRTKLIGIIALCIAIALAIGFSLVSLANTQALKRDMVVNTAVLAKVVGDNNSGALNFIAPHEARESLKSLEAIPSVRYVCIYDENHNLFAEYIRPGSENSINRTEVLPSGIAFDSTTQVFSEFRGDELALYRRIYTKSTFTCTIFMRVSTQELEARIQNNFISMTAVGLLVMLVSILLAWSLQRIVSARLIALSNFVARLSRDNDFSARFDNRGYEDEIGALSDGFNDLLAQLQRRERERDQARADLENALREDFRVTVRNLQNLVFKVYQSPSGEYLLSLFEGRIAASFGMDTEAVRGKSLVDIFGRKMQGLYQQHFTSAFQGKTVRFETELNGAIYLNFLVPIVDNGLIREVVCSTVDITSQKEAENRLRVSEQRYRALIQGLPVGIVQSVKDENGLHLEFINGEFVNLTGYSIEMLAEMQHSADIRLPIHEDDRAKSEIEWNAWLARDADTLLRRSYRLRIVKDGANPGKPAYRWFDDYSTKLRLDSGELIIIQALLDIDEKKLSEEQLQRSLVKERQVNELKTRFVSTVSHEFRTPLAGMLLSVDLLTRYFDRIPADKRLEELHKIRLRINELTDLMNDFLAQSESQSAVGRFKPVRMEVGELCKALIAEMEFIASATSRSRIQRHINVREAYINGDLKLLRYILRNLLANAIKYSPKHSTVEVRVYCEDNAVVIAVKDAGIGIPEGDLDKLFTPFFRAANTTSISGTGVGLSIAKEFVEAHGGTISVQSRLNEGSTFIVRLPLATDPANAHAETQANAEAQEVQTP
jgi:PAS domain S-box-containing protein